MREMGGREVGRWKRIAKIVFGPLLLILMLMLMQMLTYIWMMMMKMCESVSLSLFWSVRSGKIVRQLITKGQEQTLETRAPYIRSHTYTSTKSLPCRSFWCGCCCSSGAETTILFVEQDNRRMYEVEEWCNATWTVQPFFNETIVFELNFIVSKQRAFILSLSFSLMGFLFLFRILHLPNRMYAIFIHTMWIQIGYCICVFRHVFGFGKIFRETSYRIQTKTNKYLPQIVLKINFFFVFLCSISDTTRTPLTIDMDWYSNGLYPT